MKTIFLPKAEKFIVRLLLCNLPGHVEHGTPRAVLSQGKTLTTAGGGVRHCVMGVGSSRGRPVFAGQRTIVNVNINKKLKLNMLRTNSE